MWECGRAAPAREGGGAQTAGIQLITGKLVVGGKRRRDYDNKQAGDRGGLKSKLVLIMPDCG